ncbi:MAG TPA: isocitrate lyase/phosphoenolpyruvate mutase family protein [Nocardioidaceae bacterium]|nr:isocitrate lyase/phosphoenolpyruvate mutase family protein [Nocardioidaceae bacterium]
MTTSDKTAAFRTLHVPGRPLLMPNPWDVGSARLLESMGFRALATTSSGHASTLGLEDGAVDRRTALAHAAALASAVDVPVSADLENGYADDPSAVAETVAAAAAVGLAGCSIEDYDRERDRIYDIDVAAERVASAAQAARIADVVLTARAENFIRHNPDLADTIARLQAYQEAGAEVLYAPGLTDLTDIRSVVESVDRPVNVLTRPGLPPVHELAAAGVARISVGGGLHAAALELVRRAARELLDKGTYGWLGG